MQKNLNIDSTLKNLNILAVHKLNFLHVKSALKVQLMQMILVLSVKKALNAYNKSSMNTKDLQEDQGWNSMLTRLKF